MLVGTKMFNKSNSKSNFHACYLDVTINNEYHKRHNDGFYNNNNESIQTI